MKQSKNTVKNKLIATLILGLAITGGTPSKTSAMFPNRTNTHTDTRSCTTTPEGSTETSSLTSSAQQEPFFTPDDMDPVTSESNNPEFTPVTSFDALMPNIPVESYSPRISDEQEFNEIQTRERTSLFDADRDRYERVGSIGPQNSKRDMSLGEGEYVTKTGSVINASKVIKETIGGQKFSIIATQAPMQSTIDSFLDLIFSSKHVKDIVVLGNPWPYTKYIDWSISDLSDYWSSKAKLVSFKYTITRNEETEDASYYAIRYGGAKPISDSANITVVTITDKSTGKSKTVNVYNYIHWPDQQSPIEASDFDNFVSMFKDTRKLVVHSSAGIGRTGTFSACLEVLRRGATTANVRDIVTEMRTRRVDMVENPEQYSFVKEYQRRHNPYSIQYSQRPVRRQITPGSALSISPSLDNVYLPF